MINILFLISLFILFPLGEVTRYQFINGVAVSLFDIVAVINLVVVYYFILIKKLYGSLPILKPLLIFTIFCIISLIINLLVLPFSSALIAALYIIRFLAFASFYPTVFLLSIRIKQRLPTFFVIAGTLVGIFGIVQFFLYPTLQNLYYLGWDRHWYRLFATFFDPNFAGIVLLFPFFFSLFLLYHMYTKKNKAKILMFALTTVFLLISLFLTFSRTVLLALVIGLFPFFYYLKASKKIIIGIFAVFILGIITISINYKATEGTKLYRVASSTARLDSINDALIIFSRNPLFGVGFNAYRYAQYRYGFATGPNWQESHSGAGTDNSLLFVLATTGILGFSSFLFLLYRIAYKVKTTSSPVLAPVAASLLSVIVGSFFINAFFYPGIMFLFWSSLGLIVSKKH